MVEDNDTAQVTGVVLTPGDGELAVEWVPLANATGYEVQWKSGGQGYNTSDRQATVASGSTASHTLPDLANDTEYTVRVESDPDGRQRRPVFGRGDGHAQGGGRDGVDDGAHGDGGGHQRGQLHGGARQPADGERRGDGRRALGHGRAPGPDHPDVHDGELGYGPDGDRERRSTTRTSVDDTVNSDPHRDQHRHRLRRHHDRRRDRDGGGQRHRKGDGGGAHPGRRGTRGGVGAVGQRHRLRGAVEVGRAELQQQRAAGHDQFGFDREPHDPQPHQRDHVHGADESDPHGRQQRPVFGRGDGRAAGGGRDGVGDGADGDGGGQRPGTPTRWVLE